MGLILVFAALAALIVILWLIGANEPVYRIARGASWFVALRGGKDDLALSPNVTIIWSARADLPFIGSDESLLVVFLHPRWRRSRTPSH
jgi:hypothetical protein